MENVCLKGAIIVYITVSKRLTPLVAKMIIIIITPKGHVTTDAHQTKFYIYPGNHTDPPMESSVLCKVQIFVISGNDSIQTLFS